MHSEFYRSKYVLPEIVVPRAFPNRINTICSLQLYRSNKHVSANILKIYPPQLFLSSRRLDRKKTHKLFCVVSNSGASMFLHIHPIRIL